MQKRAWFRVHSFTGVITGLLLFIICWSGTFAVIAHELDWLVTPQAKSEHVVPNDHKLDWQGVYDAVQSAYPEVKLNWLEQPLYSRSAAVAVVNFPDQDFVRVYVDPISLEVLGRSSYVTVQRFFRSFHMNLFIPNRVGSYLVMSFAITLLISAIAALFFYKRWWRRFFHFKLTARAFWSELHKISGLWSLWFILIIALTSCWYLFELGRAHLGDGKLAYYADSDYGLHQIKEPESDPSLPVLSIGELVAKAKAVRPDIDINQVSYGWGTYDEQTTFYVNGQSKHWLVRNRANQLTLDSRTGEVLYNQNASDYPLYWRWSDTADPLHFGKFGGLISKLIWFLFGLILCGIILTGTWLHARRLMREKQGRHRNHWPGTLSAVAASLLVLAASAPFAIVGTRKYYGISVEGEKVLPALVPGVSAVILGWILVTLMIIGVWCYLLCRRKAPLIF